MDLDRNPASSSYSAFDFFSPFPPNRFPQSLVCPFIVFLYNGKEVMNWLDSWLKVHLAVPLTEEALISPFLFPREPGD